MTLSQAWPTGRRSAPPKACDGKVALTILALSAIRTGVNGVG